MCFGGVGGVVKVAPGEGQVGTKGISGHRGCGGGCGGLSAVVLQVVIAVNLRTILAATPAQALAVDVKTAHYLVL